MPYFLYSPQRDLLVAKGFEGVADVPCIFESDWKYAKIPSRYMRERAMGETDLASRRFPTRQSLETYGRHLTNFLEWCQSRGRAWQDLEYKGDVIDGYQRQMLSGHWSSRGEGLSKKTVNGRVDEACNFLLWATARDLRGPFRLLSYRHQYTSGSAVSSRGHQRQEIDARVGRVRVDPQKLTLPEVEKVDHWLNSVKIERGPTKALMCELILRTGIRREECVQWRQDTIPKKREAWRQRGRMVTVTLEYGAKGQKTHDANGDEKGPARQIMIPLDLAERLHDYATITRAEQRGRFVKSGSSKAEQRRRFENNPRQLFLSDITLEPVSAASLYKAWTSVSGRFNDWSPHLGRHYWACQTLMEEIKVERQVKQNAASLNNAWIYGTAMDVVLMKLQPQLGHISKETTLTYVRWVCRSMGMDIEADDWWTTYLEAGGHFIDPLAYD